MNYLKLLKSDVHSIADTIYQEDGNCVFVFDGDLDAFGLKRIFLRNLLQLFGEEYVIVSEDEYWNDKDQVSIYLDLGFTPLEYNPQSLLAPLRMLTIASRMVIRSPT